MFMKKGFNRGIGFDVLVWEHACPFLKNNIVGLDDVVTRKKNLSSFFLKGGKFHPRWTLDRLGFSSKQPHALHGSGDGAAHQAI